jgi:ACS family hexuronate transporter-like MFS transporter
VHQTASEAVDEPVTTQSYRWTILGVLWVTYVVVFISRLSVGPLAPFLKADLGISNAQVGLVLSTAAFGYTLTQIPTGWLVDRVGAYWPIATGEFIAAGCMLAVSRTSSYTWLLSFMLLTGMGCGFLMPATTQAVVVWFPRRQRATVMGVKQTAVNMGGIIGAAALPVIATAFGWRAGFLIIAIVAFGIGTLSLAFYRNPAPARRRTSPPTGQAHDLFTGLLKNRNIWLVSVAGLFMNWVELAVIGHFVLYMKAALGYSVIAAGGILAGMETAGAIARPASGVVSDWLFRGARRPLFLILASMATVFSLLIALAGPELGKLIYPVAFLLGIGSVGFGAIFFTMLSELGGPSGAGTASALGSTISMAGSILGPVAFGRIVDATGSYQLAWFSLVTIGALAMLSIFLVNEEPRRDAGYVNVSRAEGPAAPEPVSDTRLRPA